MSSKKRNFLRISNRNFFESTATGYKKKIEIKIKFKIHANCYTKIDFCDRRSQHELHDIKKFQGL